MHFLDEHWGQTVTQVSRRRVGPRTGLGRDDFLREHRTSWRTVPASPGTDIYHPAGHRASLAHFSLWNHRSYRFFDKWALRKTQQPSEVWIRSGLHHKDEGTCCSNAPHVLLHRGELSRAQKIQTAANAGLKPWLFIPGQKLRHVIWREIRINHFSICRIRVLRFDTLNWSCH